MSSSQSEDQTSSTEETTSLTPNTSESSFSENSEDSGEGIMIPENVEEKRETPKDLEEKKEARNEWSELTPTLSPDAMESKSKEKKSEGKKWRKSSSVVFTKEEPREATVVLSKVHIGWDGKIEKPHKGKKTMKTKSHKTAKLLYMLTSNPKHLLRHVEVLHKDLSYAKVYKNEKNVEIELTSENSHMPIGICFYSKGWKKTEWIVRDERGIHDSVLCNVTKKHLQNPDGRLVFSSQLLLKEKIPLLAISLDLTQMERKKDTRGGKEMYVGMHSKGCHVFVTFDTYPNAIPVWREKGKEGADDFSSLGLVEEFSVDGHLLAHSEHFSSDFQRTTPTLTSIGIYTRYTA